LIPAFIGFPDGDEDAIRSLVESAAAAVKRKN
jgi:hypothetical protein